MVMPLFDEGPQSRSRRPYATYVLAALNVAVFVYELVLPDAAVHAFTAAFGLTPAHLIGYGAGPVPVPLTLITYQFLHGDLFHLIANVWFLLVFGDNIEDVMGPLRFPAFYLLCGIGAGLGHCVADPGSNAPLIGASGAVSGVVIAYLMVRPCAKVAVLLLYRPVLINAYWVIGAFVLVQFLNLTLGSNDNVAYWAHVGGLATGAILFPLMRYKHVALFQCRERRDERPPAPDAPRA